MTQILPAADKNAIRIAVEALARGETVVAPTETVYGLAADATNPAAIMAIYEAKGRPLFNPLISHVADMKMAMREVVFSPVARRLAEAFWPGPLTLVLPRARTGSIHDLATAGLATAGIRWPAGPLADLAGALGKPLAAPSANRSGRISPTTAQDAADELSGRTALVLDGGAARVGIESTIIAFSGDSPVLLRPGGLTAEAIEAVTGVPPLRPAQQVEDGKALPAPGMMASHYAPDARVRLDVSSVEPGEALITFAGQAPTGAQQARCVIDLSPQGNLQEAAARLFSALREADASGARVIAVAPVPDHGLGAAINDRLIRAAAPRCV